MALGPTENIIIFEKCIQLISNLRHRILTEASSSLAVGYLINSIQAARHICIGCDISFRGFGRELADEFAGIPRAT